MRVLGILLAACACAAVVTPDGRPNNPYGIMTMANCGSIYTEGLLEHLRLASRLVGEWGYVRQFIEMDRTAADYVEEFVAACRALRLHPILVPRDIHKPLGEGEPDLGPRLAEFRTLLFELRSRGVPVWILEVGNEPNIGWWGEMPDPLFYADVFAGVGRAMREVYPSALVATAGLSPTAGDDSNGDGRVGDLGDGVMNNLDFLRWMFTFRRDAREYVDLVGSHPYTAHGPDWRGDRHSVVGYEAELEVLRGFGVEAPVLITEAGWSLSREVDEGKRRDWMVGAFKGAWEPDERVLAACPFELSDFVWRGEVWKPFDWVRWSDGSLTPQYEAVAALEKPEGSDPFRDGGLTIRGRVVDVEGRPVAGALVWTLPNFHAAVTGEDGSFRIDGVGRRRYRLVAAHDAYAPRARATVRGGAEGVRLRLRRVGLLANPDFTDAPDVGAEGPARGWTLGSGRAWRSGFSGGGLVLEPGSSVWQYTDYVTVRPRRTYRVRLLARGVGGEALLRLAAEFSDNVGVVIPGSGAVIARPLGREPQWVELCTQAPPGGCRIKVTVACEEGEAAVRRVWCDDAAVPVPADFGG